MNTNSKASLFIITDPSDRNLEYSTYLINLFHKKLNIINVRLNQIFIVTERTELIEKLKLIDTASSLDWVFITAISEYNDNLMSSSIDENNNWSQIFIDFFHNPVRVCNKRIFLLPKKLFLSNLSTCFKYIIRAQSNKFSFKDEQSLQEFIANNQCSTDQVKILFSNYSRMIEIKFDHQNMRDQLTKNFSEFQGAEDILEDNYVNADFYVYNLKDCLQSLPAQSKDIQFLRGKIDLDIFMEKLKKTVKTIEKSFFDYKPEELCVSFNGGKDCCVVLYLVYAVALHLGIKFPLNAFLIEIKDQFKEMNNFVQSLTKSKYTKQIIEFIYFNDSKTMKESLIELKEICPSIKGIFIGTRRSDGDYFKNLQPFAYTDADWPQYMRVNPILDWTFSEIWFFIRLLKLPYCSLYDRGYTSIDSSLNTVPNKDLIDSNGIDYLPAYMLDKQESERYSRVKH